MQNNNESYFCEINYPSKIKDYEGDKYGNNKIFIYFSSQLLVQILFIKFENNKKLNKKSSSHQLIIYISIKKLTSKNTALSNETKRAIIKYPMFAS